MPRTVKPKHHASALKCNRSDISKTGLKRIAGRGGVKRISGPVYDSVRLALIAQIARTTARAQLTASSAKRKTVQSKDVKLALGMLGMPVLG
jgi:histone H4